MTFEEIAGQFNLTSDELAQKIIDYENATNKVCFFDEYYQRVLHLDLDKFWQSSLPKWYVEAVNMDLKLKSEEQISGLITKEPNLRFDDCGFFYGDGPTAER